MNREFKFGFDCAEYGGGGPWLPAFAEYGGGALFGTFQPTGGLPACCEGADATGAIDLGGAAA